MSDYRCKVRIIHDRVITVNAKNKKEAEEEFRVDEKDCRKNMICKITERGLFFYHSSYEAWWQDSGLLSELITGEAVIVDDKA